MNGLEDIETIILAGGFGKRLQDVVSDRPKVLADVNGRPFVYFLLDQLIDAGICRVLFCTGYMGECVEATIGNQYRTLRLAYSREESPLGTGGALRNAKDKLRRDVVLVINGDSFVEINYRDFVAWHAMKNANISIAITLSDKADRFGMVELSLDERVTSFREKSNPNIDSSFYISVGVYLIARSIIDSLPSQDQLSLEVQVLPSLVGDGMFGYDSCGQFIDIGTPESYQSAGQFFVRNVRTSNLMQK